MKKLIFDKVTKEIIVKEEKQKEKKIIQVKIFLEKYKIFFEIFSTTLIGVMSLIVSFVGWQTNQRSVEIYQQQLELQQMQSEIQRAQLDIYQKQLEVQTNDREPYFTINCKSIKEDNSSKTNYLVKNEGGKINAGSIQNIDVILNIYYSSENSLNSYYCKIKEVFSLEDYVLSMYDESNKNFVFSGYDYFTFYKFEKDLESELETIYGRENIFVSSDFYLTMRFTDYKNEEYVRTYRFTSHSIEYVNYDYTEGEIYLGLIEFGADISSIANEISEKIDGVQ